MTIISDGSGRNRTRSSAPSTPPQPSRPVTPRVTTTPAATVPATNPSGAPAGRTRGAHAQTPGPASPPVRVRRGTVLSMESVPGSPGAHPAGPPPFYRWRRNAVDPAEELRRVHAIAGTMGAAIIEVISGQRAAHQLTRWVRPEVLDRITRRIELETAPATAQTGNPFLVHRFDGSGPRPQRVRAIQVAEDEYEASVVVAVGGRCRALAVRIHKPRGQWQIVEAEIG